MRRGTRNLGHLAAVGFPGASTRRWAVFSAPARPRLLVVAAPRLDPGITNLRLTPQLTRSAPVAQRTEQRFPKPKVTSSTLVGGARNHCGIRDTRCNLHLEVAPDCTSMRTAVAEPPTTRRRWTRAASARQSSAGSLSSTSSATGSFFFGQTRGMLLCSAARAGKRLPLK